MDTTTRSRTLSIVKAFGIIAMVVGHAEWQGDGTGSIYTWHMPLFFIAAGYFFSDANIHKPWEFVAKRFRKLYIPFIKWSLLFLVLHNLWHYLGILNEQYGNGAGGVTHPYRLYDFAVRITHIFTSMSGYDEFMAGAFWFFRGLLVSSIVFMVLYRLLRLGRGWSPQLCTLLICAGCVGFHAARIYLHAKLPYYPNGGYRETWGIFFFGVGLLLRRYEHRIPTSWWLIAAGLGLMWLFGHLRWSGMNNGIRERDLWSLPISGCVGFVTLYALSRRIADGVAGAACAAALDYIGRNTMVIFVWHILSYKVVSLLKIWWYDLDFAQIGCHMVIHHRNDDMFWLLYSIAGVALPLLGMEAFKRIRNEEFWILGVRRKA